jgi:CRP/FNR family transcriptional regulator, cyclic AMP receptor protein
VATPFNFQDISKPSTQFLRGQRWFADLDPETQERIADRVFTIRGNKGETMLRSGEAVKGWYAVLSGLVKLQSQISGGRRQGYLGIPGGEWFGEGSVMKNEPRRYDVIALRDSELLCLPRAQFEELRATNLKFNQAIAEFLNMRLGQAMLIIETSRLRTPEQRVAMYLTGVLWHGPRKLSLSQEELGILVGLSRQSINQALKSLEQQRLVSLDFGRVSILDDPGLTELALRDSALSEEAAG